MLENTKNEIEQYYEEWWENPGDPRACIFNELNSIVRIRMPNGKGKNALDIGSGKGTIVRLLLENSFHVTALDINEKFLRGIKSRHPETCVIVGDFITAQTEPRYDLVTAIEFIQNLDRDAVREFFKRVATITDNLIMSISVKNSLHGRWASYRGFQKSFVHTYTVDEIERLLVEAGFQIDYGKGIGLVTPLTLFPAFKGRLIPTWFAKAANLFGDKLFPKRCHLYYLEATRRARQ